MFKNKKMSKGNLLILALSLLLVVSLSFSLTRAWFLRKGTAVNHKLDFGYISTLTETNQGSIELYNLVPGDTITGLADYTVAYSADVDTTVYAVFKTTAVSGLTMAKIFGTDVTIGAPWGTALEGLTLTDGFTGSNVYKIQNNIGELETDVADAQTTLANYSYTVDMPTKINEALTLEEVYPAGTDLTGFDVTVTIQVFVIQTSNMDQEAQLAELGIIEAPAEEG